MAEKAVKVVRIAKAVKALRAAKEAKVARVAISLRASLRLVDVNLTTTTLQIISSFTDMALEKNEIMSLMNTSYPV